METTALTISRRVAISLVAAAALVSAPLSYASPAPVTVRKDDALAANQAALAKVADRGTFSSCGGLIHITSG
jgi:hypothetical protein